MSASPGLDSLATLRAARVEAVRCARAIEKGGAPAFWRNRLETAAKQLEAAAAILRMELAAIQERQPGHTNNGKCRLPLCAVCEGERERKP